MSNSNPSKESQDLPEVDEILQETHEHLLYDPKCEVCRRLYEAKSRINKLLIEARINEISLLQGFFDVNEPDFDHASYDWIYTLLSARIAELKASLEEGTDG